jgi:hypothetical protein
MKKIIIALIALALFLPATGIAKKKNKDLMGTYTVKGFNPGVATSGTPSYTGTLEITQSDGAYLLNWKVGEEGKQIYKGVGIYTSGVLSVGFSGEEDAGGVISYKVEKGALKGVWAPHIGGAFGFELAERR